MTDYLCLKWGSLKACDIESEAGMAALCRFWAAGERQESAIMQNDTLAQKEALCRLIDALDCETVCNGWSGDQMTKDEAKKYVREYRT